MDILGVFSCFENFLSLKAVNSGVYADAKLEEKELVLKDQMLAGIQHSSNKVFFVSGAFFHGCLLMNCLPFFFFFFFFESTQEGGVFNLFIYFFYAD